MNQHQESTPSASEFVRQMSDESRACRSGGHFVEGYGPGNAKVAVTSADDVMWSSQGSVPEQAPPHPVNV